MLIGCPLPILLLEIEGTCSPLIDKVGRQVQIPLDSGGLIQADQSHLGDLMARIAVQLIVGRSEGRGHIVGEPLGRMQKLGLARALVIGDGAFNQMAQAVELMMILEIGEVPVHPVEDVVGIQVSAVQLGRTDDVDGPVGQPLQLGIRMMRQRVPHGLHPFGEVGVLENVTIELVRIGMIRVFRQAVESLIGVSRRLEVSAPLLPIQPLVERGGGAKVVHTVAGRSTRHLVVECPPLVGQDRCSDQLLLGRPEGVVDTGLADVNRPAHIELLTHAAICLSM